MGCQRQSLKALAHVHWLGDCFAPVFSIAHSAASEIGLEALWHVSGLYDAPSGSTSSATHPADCAGTDAGGT